MNDQSQFLAIHHSPNHSQLLTLPVQRMTAAATAELLELQPIRRVLLVLGRYVVALLAFGALQNNVISRHRTSSPGNPLLVLRK